MAKRDVTAQFQERDDLPARDVWISGQEIINAVAGFKEINEGLDGDARPAEAGRAVHGLRINRDDLGQRIFFVLQSWLRLPQDPRTLQVKHDRL